MTGKLFLADLHLRGLRTGDDLGVAGAGLSNGDGRNGHEENER